VADGDRGVGIEQKHGHGLADDVAAAHDDGFLSGDWDVRPPQDFHDTAGSARHESWALRGEKPDVHRVEAVDILGGIDRHQHLLGIDLWRQGKLDEDAVNVVASVQLIDQVEQFPSSDRLRRRVLLAVEADFLAALDLSAHVDFGGGVVAGEDHGQPGTQSGLDKRLHFGGDFGADLAGDSCAVQ
jgi:hypothetical protein